MRFKKIYIEITNTCNLSCSFCIQNQRKPKQMTIEEFTYVIDQIKPYTKYIYLHVMGEPLSHPDLKQFLSICEKANIMVNMTTNGTLLKQKADILLSSKIRQINISLHSFPQHMQEAYIENAVMVGKQRAQKGCFVSYRLWCMKHGMLDDATKAIVKTLEALYSCEIKEIEKGSVRLSDYTFLHFEEVFEWPDRNHPYVGDKGYCLGMKQMCGILSNGDVVPCCLDSKADICLGNIFETPMKEILSSKRVIDMVQAFAKQEVKEELCQRCSYRLRFSKDTRHM